MRHRHSDATSIFWLTVLHCRQLQRVIEYLARGFAIVQDVPSDLTDAYQWC